MTVTKSILLLLLMLGSASKAQNCTQEFQNFRDALYQSDKAKAKTYFKFPLPSDLRDLWFLAEPESEADEKQITEADFDANFSRLFPKPLIKCMLKIKSKALCETGESESPEITDGDTTFKLYATFNKKERLLTLSLATSFPVPESNEFGETSYIYVFKISPDGKMRFHKFFIAG